MKKVNDINVRGGTKRSYNLSAISKIKATPDDVGTTVTDTTTISLGL